MTQKATTSVRPRGYGAPASPMAGSGRNLMTTPPMRSASGAEASP